MQLFFASKSLVKNIHDYRLYLSFIAESEFFDQQIQQFEDSLADMRRVPQTFFAKIENSLIFVSVFPLIPLHNSQKQFGNIIS